MRHVLAFASVLVALSLPLGAQPSLVRLKIGASVPTLDSALRVQAAACVDDRCLVAYGGMRDSADLVAWPTVYWTRVVNGVADTVSRMLPEWSRPTGPIAVAPDLNGGFLLLWTDAGSADTSLLGLRLDSLGLPTATAWTVSAGPFRTLRVFDGNDGHLVIAEKSDTSAIVLRLRGYTTAVIDTIAVGASRAWRAHGLDDVVAIPTSSDTTAAFELRAVDTWSPLGIAPAVRFRRAHRFESDGGLWTVLDSTLQYFTRFDDASPARSVSTRDIATAFRDALWITKPADSSIALEYVRFGSRLEILVRRREVQGDTLGPEIERPTLMVYYDTPQSVYFGLRAWSFVTAGVRAPVLRFEYTYNSSNNGNNYSGIIGASVVIDESGRGYAVRDIGLWKPVDAEAGGSPISLYRIFTLASQTIHLRTTLRLGSIPVASPIALTRVETGQRAPAVAAGRDGYGLFWIEEVPNVPRALKAARWNGVADTVTVTGSIEEYFAERPPEYRTENRVGHLRYPGASVGIQIMTEMSHPERLSHPAWDKASWSAHRGSPLPGWGALPVGALEVPYMSGRPPYPAGGGYFHTSLYDPVRDEVVLLAAEGLDDLVLAGVPTAPSVPWRLTLPVMSPTAIVPVGERDIVALFGDSLVRVSATGSRRLSRRLEIPVRLGDGIARQFDESFLHLRIDTTVATMRRYSLDGELRARVQFRVARGLAGSMIAVRASDSAIAIVSSDGRAIRLTLLDRELGVRIEDSVLVRSDGDVRAPQASFIDGELVVVWEDVLEGDPDIAIARAVIDDVPAGLSRETIAGRAVAPFVRVIDPVIRGGRIELEVVGRTGAPIAIELVDARGAVVARATVGERRRDVLDVDRLPAGPYLVRATRSGAVVTSRIILAR